MQQYNSVGKGAPKNLGFPNPGTDATRHISYSRWNKVDWGSGSHLKRGKFAGGPTWGKVISSSLRPHEVRRSISDKERNW